MFKDFIKLAIVSSANKTPNDDAGTIALYSNIPKTESIIIINKNSFTINS